MLATPLGERVRERLRADALQAPAHFDAEVLSGIRRSLRLNYVSVERAELAVVDLAHLRLRRVSLGPLLSEAFALRDRFSAHDAFYVVLARRRDAALVTADSRLARAAEGITKVVLVAA